MLVQCFYAWRIHKVYNDGVVIPCLVIICTVTQFATTVYAMPIIINHPSLVYLATALFSVAAWIWLAACVLGDLIITSTMFYFLHMKARRNPNARNKLRTFGKHCLQANMLALLTQVYVVATFTLAQTGFWFILGTFSICKILTFCMFSSFKAHRGTAVVDSQSYPRGAYSLPVVKSAHYALPEIVTSQMSDSRRTTLSNIQVISESTVEVDSEDHSWEPSKRTRFLRQFPVTVQLTPLTAMAQQLLADSSTEAFTCSKYHHNQV